MHVSYKWGNINRLEVNFPSLARSMFNSAMSPQDKRLPLTFRDAIKVARGIGISYLWIDALCIWQDDDDDKRLELEKMNKYYANCTLVIQASGTESVSDSFLDLAHQSRNHGVFENYLEPFPFRSSDGQEDTIYVCLGENFDWYRKSDQPAAKRGWIFQEEILCRRILVFPAGGGMIFRCDSRDMEMDDGNVFYDPDIRDPPRYWIKDRLLEQKEDLSPALVPLSGRFNGLMEQVRSLSEMPGLKPSLWMTDGGLEIRFGGNDDSDGSSKGNVNDASDEPSEGNNNDDFDGQSEGNVNDDSDGLLKGNDNDDSDWPSEGNNNDDSVVLLEGDINNDSDGSSEGICFIPVRGRSTKAAAYAKTVAILRLPGFPDTLVHTQTPPGVALPNEVHDIWKHLVTDYCTRDLTKPSDKLIAIDALAREFQERYGRALGSYHAGLWFHFVPAGLLWCSTRPAPSDAGFCLPSWSWASVPAASYPDPGRHTGDLIDGAEFKDADIQLSSFVSAEEGGDGVKQIRLIAKLLEVWWDPDTIPQKKPRKRVSQQEGASYAIFQEDGPYSRGVSGSLSRLVPVRPAKCGNDVGQAVRDWCWA